MTPSTNTRAAERQLGLAVAISSAAERLSIRVHAAGDARARDLGWEITRTAARAGLAGRTYRDPRFATRAATAGRVVTPEGRRAA
ncbi:MAG: hypothetical protein ACYCO9_10160 [Streptosporangiaceae bacterium]